MKLKPLGKLTILILVFGLAFGGYKMWSQSRGASTIPTTGQTTTGQTTVSREDTAQSSGGGGETGANTNAQPVSSNEIQIISSNTKKGWLADQIEAFNDKQGDGVKVVAKAVETREAMTGILDGKYKPALWSPSSVIWADRLGEVWEERTGKTLLDTGDVNSYRQIFKSPIVFLTTKEKSKFLRPLLENDAWVNIRKISDGKIRAPYGKFKWSHADPLNANSGMLTMALIVSDYAQKNGQSGAIRKVAQSTTFATYLKSLERDFVYDEAVRKGSSALVKSFADDPSRYDFVTAYESAALEQVLKNPDFTVIYPSPTVNAEQAIAALDWPDMSAAQKTAARDFLAFLASKSSVNAGLKEYFRPSRGDNPAIARYKTSGFQSSYNAIEVPPYIALNDAGYRWSKAVAGQ